jgi:DME family drug/metabolite transporter
VSSPSSHSGGYGWALVMLAAVTWGTSGTTSRLLASHAGAGPFLVGFVRVAVAAPLLMLAAWRLEDISPPRSWAPLGAGICMAAYQVCFFSAVPSAGVAIASLLAICTAPLMIALLAALFLHERLTLRTMLALGLGVAGTALLVGGGRSGPHLLLGGVLALLAGFGYAVYAIISKAALARTSPLPLSAWTFSIAAVLLIPALLVNHPSPHVIAAGWPLFLYLGVIPTAVAYGLYTHGLRRTTATVAGISSLLEPLTATVLGLVIFHEHLGLLGAVGGILLLAGLVLLVTDQE